MPNKCKPFDAQTNNPFAVQCVAAYPAYHTPYAGDENCILPPPPDEGVQYGVHALGADEYWPKLWAGDYSHYHDAQLLKAYEVAPGQESTQNYVSRSYTTSSVSKRYFYRYNFRGRPGSHHSVAQFTSGPVSADQEGWMEDMPDGKIDLNGGTIASVQRAYTDVPAGSVEVPPEEAGIGLVVPAGAGSHLSLHYFNPSDSETLLREQWINVWFLDHEPVSRAVESFILTKIDYPANSVLENTYAAAVEEPTRLLSVFGHRHAWTTRFNAWLQHADGTPDQPLYDSYSWEDMPTYHFDSATKNPRASDEAKTDGAYSGVVDLKPGDKIWFSCHVDTTATRAGEVKLPVPTHSLTYANEATTGEMCVLGTVTTDVMLKSIGGKDLLPPSD